MLRRFFVPVALLAATVGHAGECPWMANSRLDAAFPDRAPWTLMAGGRGRCKFVSDESKPASTISLTQMVEASPKEAEEYVKTVGAGMAETYAVKAIGGIGKAGVAVRERSAADSRMLTLIGHQKNVVVMTQMSFFGGVDAAQQAKALELTQATFTADTGGGLQMPSP